MPLCRLHRAALAARSLTAIASLAAIPLLATAASPAAREVTASRSFQETLRFAPGAGERRVDVDNLDGPVTVVGEERDDVALTVHETITADTAALLEEARRDVRLERRQDSSAIRIVACGPFRDENGRCCRRGWDDLGYRVAYTIEARVPRDVRLLARTVNDGDVAIEGVRGTLRVENVNGAVRAERVAGSGTFGTVNGNLQVAFAANPSGPVAFSNVNGDIDVELLPGLAADLRLKTLNGEIWTDFPYTPLPLVGETRRSGARFVYSNHHSAAVRIAGGGPELRFETVNGEIRIHRRAR
jgi:hypothetical protein